jgi:protein TonB
MTRARQFLTAHEVFKRGSRDRTAIGILCAVAVHLSLFALLPPFETVALASANDPTPVLNLPPEVVVPPPPEAILRPAAPRLTAGVPADDATIDVVPFDDGRWRAPPIVTDHPPVYAPRWIQRDQDPRLLNADEITRELERLYPALLKEAGIGGVVVMWVFVGVDGRPGRAEVHASSGYPALDEAARRVADGMRFEPARNRDRPVAVWIQIPVKFSAR